MVFQNTGLQKTFFIVTGILCAVLQVGIAPHMAILNGHPNFALIFAGCAMATLPGTTSVLCAFFAGVFFDLVGAGPFGLMPFCLTLMNFLCSLNSAKRMGESWLESYRLFCVCAVCVEFTVLIGEAIAGDVLSLSAVLTAFLPAVFWDCLCALPFFYVLGRLTPTASSADGGVGASKYADKSYSLSTIDKGNGAGITMLSKKGAKSSAKRGIRKGLQSRPTGALKKSGKTGFQSNTRKGFKSNTKKGFNKGLKKGA